MTPSEDVDLIRRFFESWATGDMEASLECLHPDVEIDWSESIAPFRDTFAGHQSVWLFWHEMRDAWEEFEPRVDDHIELGDGRLITTTTIHGRAKTSGIEVEATGAVLWSVREGRITHAKLFQTTGDAVEGARRTT